MKGDESKGIANDPDAEPQPEEIPTAGILCRIGKGHKREESGDFGKKRERVHERLRTQPARRRSHERASGAQELLGSVLQDHEQSRIGEPLDGQHPV